MKEPRLTTPAQVYRKYAAHLHRLKEMRDRLGPDWSDLQELQLRGTEAFLEDLGRTFGTDGHGRPNVPEEAA